MIRWAAVAAATCAFAAQAGASPVVFSALNQSDTLLFSASQDGATLNATVKFTLTSWTATSATFATVVTNSSSGAGGNTLMSFGIDTVTPTLTGASTSSPAWSAGINATLPSFQKVDLCIWDSNNCSGGNINDGLGEGASASFNLLLTTSGNFLQGITFASPYGIKFQDVGRTGQSFEFAGCIQGQDGCGGATTGGTTVPEPNVLALIAIGALAAGLTRRTPSARRA
ncbi:hypothetical protein CDN99_20855 [Roseateles aquatilis]|uniref:PEP-CTERM protein-sorting domain-containing protein n=2 Tax=Roseateles aquatilis TaxID=431061 RepID=A0A246J289_9BURK|nr:hypothetical protein CDN99_20855 [Roseateles aquatilis]